MLPDSPHSHNDLRARFAWQIPARFNIGIACADAHAAHSPRKPAIIDVNASEPQVLTFGDLASRSSALAAALDAHGLRRGDRIAIMLPQCFDAVIAHLAVYKLGAIAVPLATQFGPDAIAHRLSVSGARALIGYPTALARAQPFVGACETPPLSIVSGGAAPGAVRLDALIEKGRDEFAAAPTAPDDPAMMLFTSGTTGQPKGALHGHRVLLGHLPGIALSQDLMPRPGDRLWTPSDWAWAGGLLNALLPALHHGVPVIAARAPRFSPEWAVDVMARSGATNAFMPATALRLMQSMNARTLRDRLTLRVIGTAGEALGRQTLAAATEAFGVPVNEFYGQTECNAVLANCAALGIGRAGSMGLPVPGHEVAILRQDSSPADADEPGEIAVRAPDPVMFLNYWNEEAATRARFSGDWLMTGDQARRDADGYVHFIGRGDDLITSAGYRIGPGEIEDCLMAHEDIELAAVIGEPDPVRTQIVSAYVKLRAGAPPEAQTRKSIADFVKRRLSAHEYPRRITFVDHVPLTESGKVIRRHFRRD
ncbi:MULTISPECIES: AMP-binding protein [unclassified Roseitalea]|uniref:AMP-binding protein n=1 Tax=unclassified Roseitalea TaxID=2639107 RepID=UPI00273E09B7|nr:MULTISPECIES: AMP-binding protein [unclassified Roseitalea]